MRVALLVAYDGTGFHGFARQPGQRTVQGVLEEALSNLLRVPVTSVGAGRTDAGVHAWGQVVSFDAPDGTDVARVVARMNRWVGPEIAVRAGTAVPDGFSARFDATRRIYEYRMYRGGFVDPFRERFAVHAPDLRVAPMRAAARAIVGEHDFSAFCRRGQMQPVRRVRRVSLPASGDAVTFRVEADSFCQQMVRALTGMLIEVGRGRRPPEDLGAVLAGRERAAAAPVAPAKGLHLLEVRYRPDPFR